jgi:hypothetical protein
MDWGWLSSNILAPVLIPVLGLTIGKALPLEAKYAKKTHWMSQFRDGQLGWVAVAWAAGIFYDILIVTVPLTPYLKLNLLAAVFLGFGGMVISAGGAIESDPAAAPRKRFLVWSMVIAVATGFFAYNVHVEADGLSHAFTEHPSGEQ